MVRSPAITANLTSGIRTRDLRLGPTLLPPPRYVNTLQRVVLVDEPEIRVADQGPAHPGPPARRVVPPVSAPEMQPPAPTWLATAQSSAPADPSAHPPPRPRRIAGRPRTCRYVPSPPPKTGPKNIRRAIPYVNIFSASSGGGNHTPGWRGITGTRLPTRMPPSPSAARYLRRVADRCRRVSHMGVRQQA